MPLRSTRRSCIASSPTWYGPDISARFHVVTNGYDADILEPYASASPAAAPPLVLTHAGNLYGARNPLPLLEGLAKCLRDGAVPAERHPPQSRRQDRVSLRCGHRDCSPRLGRLRHPTLPVPHHESLRLLAASHVLVVIQPDTHAAGAGEALRVCRTSPPHPGLGRGRRGRAARP